MKLNTKVILFLFVILPYICNGQYSFEKTIATEDSEAFYDAFEDNNGNYICVGRIIFQGIGNNMSPFLMKLSPSGKVLTFKYFYKPDTTSVFQFGLQKDNGNYLFLGTLSDSLTPSNRNYTYLCETDQELQIMQERYYKIPDPYHSHTIENFLVTPDQELIVQGRADYSMYGHNDDLVLLKFDTEGNLLIFNMPENWRDAVAQGDMLINPDGEGFYLIGGILEYSFSRDWVEFDFDLNLLGYGDVEDSLSPMGVPLSVKRMANGNYFMANGSFQYPPYNADDLEIRILDNEFNIVKDTILDYDEEMYLPVHNGMDFISEDNIWVSVFESWPTSFTGIEEFYVHIFDSGMRLKGTGIFGGDKRYWLYDLTATSDGGCLIVGNVPDYDGATIKDAYAVKIMPNDIITNIEALSFSNDPGASVYPNPFRDFLYAQAYSGEMTLSLYNIYGQEVVKKNIPNDHKIEILTSGMKTGVYPYLIENKSGIIETGKLIKN